MRRKWVWLLGLMALWAAAQAKAEEPPFRQVPASIRVLTTVSAGQLTPEEVVAEARAEGVRVLVITDQLLVRAEYGLWPLRRLLRRVVERPSVLAYGPERYLKELAELDRRYPEVLVIPGVDVAPAYYYEGSPLRGDLEVRQWSEQMTVIGLTDPEALRGAPVVANPYRRVRPLGAPGLLVGPLAALITSALICWRIRYGYTGTQRLLRPLAAAAGVGSLLLLINNFPYSTVEPSPYGGDPGVEPYQDFIDYARRRGALVFWSHPEAAMETSISGVRLLTRPYTDHVEMSRGATGLAVLYGDARRAHLPGELWDRLLLEYTRGERAQPLWGIGEVDFHGEPLSLRQVETVLMLREVSADEVIEALAAGRSYARGGGGDLRLRLGEFVVTDPAAGAEARSGGTLRSSRRVSVLVQGGTEPRGEAGEEGSRGGASTGRAGTVTLVRGGEVVRRERFRDEFRVQFEEDLPAGMTYYRVLVEHPRGGELISNPIFVRVSAPRGRAEGRSRGAAAAGEAEGPER